MPCAGGRGSLPGRVCSLDVTVQANQSGVTPQEVPTSLKKAKLESAHKEGTDTGLLLPQEPFKRDTVATEGAGGVFSQ